MDELDANRKTYWRVEVVRTGGKDLYYWVAYIGPFQITLTPTGNDHIFGEIRLHGLDGTLQTVEAIGMENTARRCLDALLGQFTALNAECLAAAAELGRRPITASDVDWAAIRRR